MSILFLWACTSKDPISEDSYVPPPTTGSRDSVLEGDCDEHAPVIEDLIIEDGGFRDNGDDEFQTIVFRFSISDEDGDLSPFAIHIWSDLEADGAVDTSAAPIEQWSNSDDPLCEAFEIPSYDYYRGIGGAIPFDTLVEFGVEVVDAHGRSSDLLIQTLQTPAEQSAAK